MTITQSFKTHELHLLHDKALKQLVESTECQPSYVAIVLVLDFAIKNPTWTPFMFTYLFNEKIPDVQITPSLAFKEVLKFYTFMCQRISTNYRKIPIEHWPRAYLWADRPHGRTFSIKDDCHVQGIQFFSPTHLEKLGSLVEPNHFLKNAFPKGNRLRCSLAIDPLDCAEELSKASSYCAKTLDKLSRLLGSQGGEMFEVLPKSRLEATSKDPIHDELALRLDRDRNERLLLNKSALWTQRKSIKAYQRASSRQYL